MNPHILPLQPGNQVQLNDAKLSLISPKTDLRYFL